MLFLPETDVQKSYKKHY